MFGIKYNELVDCLLKQGFKKDKQYVYKRNYDSAHLGTTGGKDDSWAVAIYIKNESGLFYSEEKLKKFILNSDRKIKLEILLED